MKLLILLIGLTLDAYALVPQDWITASEQLSPAVSELPQDSRQSIQQIMGVHEEVLSAESFSRKNLRLNRFDVEVGVSLGGELGVLAMSGQSAVEFIWARKEKKNEQDVAEVIQLENEDPEMIFRELQTGVDKFIRIKKLSRKKRLKIVRILRRDAVKIGKLVKEMTIMPRVGDWYVDSFLKIYTFSSSGKILSVLEGHSDKRIRFRFSFSAIPLKKAEKSELVGSQHFHYKLLSALNMISRMENPEAKFRLGRARARTELNHTLNLLFFETSQGHTIQPEYKKVPPEFSQLWGEDFSIPEDQQNLLVKPFSISEKIVQSSEGKAGRDFELSQIRTKFSFNTETGFWLSTIEKSSVFELHFLRQDPTPKNVTFQTRSRTPRLIRTDYRQRLGLRLSIPELGKVRVRASVEHRYRVK